MASRFVATPQQVRAFVASSAGHSNTVLDFTTKLIQLQHGMIRRNGVPTIEHLREVQRLVSLMLKASPYERAAIAAALGHDLDEDVMGPLTLSNKDYQKRKREGTLSSGDLAEKTVLNSYFERFDKQGVHKEGAWTVEMIHNVTRPANKQKMRHLEELFQKKRFLEEYVHGKSPKKIRAQQEQLALVILSIVIKTADRYSNTNHKEKYAHKPNEAMGIIETAAEQGDARVERLIDILKKRGIIKSVRKMLPLDESIFTDAGKQKLFIRAFDASAELVFRTDQETIAIDNSTHLLPNIEIELLIKPGLHKGKWSQAKAEDSLLYNYESVRSVIRLTYLETLAILERLNFSEHPINLVRGGGDAKGAWKIKSYDSVLRDIERGMDSITSDSVVPLIEGLMPLQAKKAT
jgi:hypothetical protein